MVLASSAPVLIEATCSDRIVNGQICDPAISYAVVGPSRGRAHSNARQPFSEVGTHYVVIARLDRAIQ
jgi:hypothetical protein